jgi:transposase
MDIIHRKTGVKYHEVHIYRLLHEVHIYRLLHKWGFSPKVPRKRLVNTASNEEKKQFQKRLRK